VASLQARSPLRSAHPLFFLNKLVSLTAFTLLLGVGWLVVSFLKSDSFDRLRNGSTETVSASRSVAVPVRDTGSPEAKPLMTPVRLVYSCADDRDYYHASTHLPARCERTALSEEAAGQRGMKRCKVCFPE
jgi:hypothetical protein